ncbi:InlB B-repeat-containing protein [Anaerovoracaceae bacterium 42-11]
MVNQGAAASADKTVEFTYGSKEKIGVTAQKIPASSGNTVTVQYQTTKTENDTWTTYSGSTLTSSGGFVTFTAQMAGLGESEYFTKIKANVGSYEKDYVGYVASRAQDPTSGYATTFGKLLTSDAGTYTNFASMKMYDTASGGSTVKSGNYTVKVTKTRGEIPLAMEQAYKEGTLERVPILSKTSATAGETITFNGLLSSSAYPYSSNNIATDQEIYIRLPEKITVENLKLYQEVGRIADKVFLSDAVTETVTNPTRTEIPNTEYKFEEVTSTAADGYKLYKITFTNQENPAKVGWFTDGLGQYQIGISFDMNIAKDADAMTLDMRDCVRFKSASLTSTSNNGTLAQYQVMDNGVRYSTFNANAKGTKLSVVAARLGLTFTFGARVAGENSTAEFDATKYSNFEVDKNTVYLKDANHVVDLLFTLKNETGREFSKADAQAFYYFIPVPKKGDLWDSHMQDHAFEFDMALTGAAELSGASAERNHIQVTYSTTVDSSASAGDSKHYSTVTDNYVTADKINDWGAVKMIRVAATEDTEKIPEDADLKVNLRLKPMFNDNADLVGSEINFGPCGVSPYSVGNTPNQGHNPLPRIQVEFQTGIIGGKIFIDKNFNGTYDEGTDELYKDGVTVEANHSNGNENCTEGDAAHKTTASDGKFKFTGRRADTYHVVVTNPGSTNANGDNPLKFSLPESGGKFSLDAGKNTATASVVLDMNKTSNDIQDAQKLMIGFQQPHTVTFSVPNGQGGTTTNIWHGEKLAYVPTVTANEGYRFTGWKVGNTTYANDASGLSTLRELLITEDTTVTAEVKKLYSVSYNLNDGGGANAPATTQHIEGEQVRPDYTGTGNLKKGEDTIFVGWSEEQITEPLPADAAQEDIDKIISKDAHTMPAHNVVLYAVYAVDANGNDKPDYNDDAVKVRYHGNNNDYTDIICPHHHVVGETVQLSTNGKVSGKRLNHYKSASDASGEVKNHTFTYGDNIFIGWSTTAMPDVIATNAQYGTLEDSIVTEVTMAKADGGNADDDGNTNVYAVWAADRNGNKTADYLEERRLIYDGNAQEGTVTNLPNDTNIYLPGNEVTLSTAVPTHDDVGDKKVVFIGWTETKTNSIFSRTDTAPTTITKVTFREADKTVYAAWGYDENGDNTADVLETYTLTYDLNGGKGTTPTKVEGIKKNTEVKLTEAKNFTRYDKEIFVGWSATKRDAALTAQDEQENVGKFLIAPGANYRITTADVTLYAVWAIDSNGDGTPDYQTTYTVSYDLDGGTAADGETYDEENVKPGETITVKAAPIRSGYAFAGWYDGTKTYKPGDNVTILDADLKLTAQWTSNGGGGSPGTDPDDSDNPDDPDNPDNPDDPDNPDNPDNPDDPDNPDNPDKPGKPDKPNKPGDTNNTTNPANINTDPSGPKTGDTADPALWIILFGVSCIGIACTLAVSRRKSRKTGDRK